MVTKFTWAFKSTERLRTKSWPEPIIRRATAPFQSISHNRHSIKYVHYYGGSRKIEANHKDNPMDLVEFAHGDVYQFKNAQDGTYLTAIVSKKNRIVQFQKGKYELGPEETGCSPPKQLRPSSTSE